MCWSVTGNNTDFVANFKRTRQTYDNTTFSYCSEKFSNSFQQYTKYLTIVHEIILRNPEKYYCDHLLRQIQIKQSVDHGHYVQKPAFTMNHEPILHKRISSGHRVDEWTHNGKQLKVSWFWFRQWLHTIYNSPNERLLKTKKWDTMEL